MDKKILKELKSNGFMQQRQENYFSMRLKNVGGHFTAEQLGTIKVVAEIFGAGYIHLTSRQGIEIPFIKFNDIPAVKATLAAGGVEVGVCGARIRTITACQGNAICSSGNIDTLKIARELDRRYGGRELPHKFKIGVTGCANNCLKAEENDIGIKGGAEPNWIPEKCIFCGACKKICPAGAIEINRAEKIWAINRDKCINCGRCVKICKAAALNCETGFIISFGGRYGNKISVGKKILPLIKDEQTLYRVIEATLNFFNERAKMGERLSLTFERLGAEEFTEKIREAYDGQKKFWCDTR